MRQWQALEVDSTLQDGIDAHALVAELAHTRPTLEKISRRARMFAARFEQMQQEYELHDWREQYQKIYWKGITLRRIIDAGGIWKGEKIPVLIDYKTATWPWEIKGGVTAKAIGFQTTIYLIPPDRPKDLGPFREWPAVIDYLVAPERGADQTFRAERSQPDEANLVEAVEMVETAASRNKFPKNRGFNCKYCSFFDLCYQTEGWKQKYLAKPTEAIKLEAAE